MFNHIEDGSVAGHRPRCPGIDRAWDIRAIVDRPGTIAERYACDPIGRPTARGPALRARHGEGSRRHTASTSAERADPPVAPCVCRRRAPSCGVPAMVERSSSECCRGPAVDTKRPQQACPRQIETEGLTIRALAEGSVEGRSRVNRRALHEAQIQTANPLGQPNVTVWVSTI